MTSKPPSGDGSDLSAIAKVFGDLDDLIRLLSKGLSRAKPWQQHRAAHLAEADRLMQILRLTITLDRPDAEILAAAVELRLAAQQAQRALVGTRADRATLAATRLAADLAASIALALQRSCVTPL